MRFFRDIREAISRRLPENWINPTLYDELKYVVGYGVIGFTAANTLILQKHASSIFSDKTSNYCNGQPFAGYYEAGYQLFPCDGDLPYWLKPSERLPALMEWSCAVVLGTLAGVGVALHKLGQMQYGPPPQRIKINIITAPEKKSTPSRRPFTRLFDAKAKTFTERLEAIGFDVTEAPEVFFCNLTKTLINKPVLFNNRICDQDQVLKYFEVAVASNRREFKDPFGTQSLMDDIKMEQIISLYQDIENFVIQKEREFKSVPGIRSIQM